MSKQQPDEEMSVQNKANVNDADEKVMPGSGSGGQDPAPLLVEGADPAQLLAELEQVGTEFADQKEKYLRALAEVDNTRRRAETDISNARKFAIEGFAAEVLSVRDSLELARTTELSDKDTGIVEKIKEGLDLTLKQLDAVFGKFGIKTVEPAPGDKLNPELHQAMTIQESDQVAPNHIVAVIQKGYSIHDRLLRPAMVIVAKADSNHSVESSEG